MFESEADRLASIKALGGVSVSASGGSFYGLLEADYANAEDVDSNALRLTARSSDVAARSLANGSTLTIGATTYTVRSVQPDGVVESGAQSGMTVLILEGP